MSVDLAHIQKRLGVEGEKTVAFFESLSPSDWEQQVYTTGANWKVKQIFAHLISAERAYQRWIREVLEGGEGPPRDLDIDAFNEAEAPALSVASIEELILMYRQARLDTLDLCRTLTERDLTRIGYHPWFGERELGWFLKLLYRHNTLHVQDVRKALQAGGALPHTDAHQAGRRVNPAL